jgi:hypothetical protein
VTPVAATPRRSLTVRSLELVGTPAVFLLGFLLHFAYDWSGGSRAVAAVAPVNESVWEHLKLVVIPVTVLGVVEMAWGVDRRRLWWAKLVEIAVACVFIVAFFYTYTGAFGVHSIIAVDIASFLVAVALGQWTSYRLVSARGRVPPLWLSVTGAMLVLAGFAVLTFAPPHVPLFQETSSGAYGPT